LPGIFLFDLSSANKFDGIMFKLFGVCGWMHCKPKPWGAAPNLALPWAAAKEECNGSRYCLAIRKTSGHHFV
jgi:hypothetical protein